MYTVKLFFLLFKIEINWEQIQDYTTDSVEP
jgi:hypothetical protein